MFLVYSWAGNIQQNSSAIIYFISNVFKLDHISYLFNSSPFFSDHVYSIWTLFNPFTWFTVSHLTFLYVLNYASYSNIFFNLILHSLHFLQEMHFLVFIHYSLSTIHYPFPLSIIHYPFPLHYPATPQKYVLYSPELNHPQTIATLYFYTNSDRVVFSLGLVLKKLFGSNKKVMKSNKMIFSWNGQELGCCNSASQWKLLRESKCLTRQFLLFRKRETTHRYQQ